MAQDKQEPKKTKELHCAECGQYLPTALTKHTYEDCENYKAQFQPRLAALTQRVKELEETLGLTEIAREQLKVRLESADSHIESLEAENARLTQQRHEDLASYQLALRVTYKEKLETAEKQIAALESQLKPVSDKPKVICLCGSTRFTAEMLAIHWTFAKEGIICLGWEVYPTAEPSDHLAEKQGIAEQFDELHKRKIDLADEIFVLNVGGYIGKSTRSEIDYAIAHNKLVKYLESGERLGK